MRLNEENLDAAPAVWDFFIILTLFMMAFPQITSAQGLSVAHPSQGTIPASEPLGPSLMANELPAGSAYRGKALFTGETPFQNGGPPCKSCHSIDVLPFPNGGTLGPNLTGVYKKLGLHGMQVSMKTLYFHVMTPIYNPHPLTLEEQSDLIAFFKDSGAQPHSAENTGIIALAGFIGFLILLAVSGFLWRNRIKPVRRTLVERALRQGGHPL
ncbi:MAG: hypothetical protein ACRD2P_10570 [Terriglobia bacterium]